MATIILQRKDTTQTAALFQIAFQRTKDLVCYNFKVVETLMCLNAVEVPSCWPSAHCMNEMSLHTR